MASNFNLLQTMMLGSPTAVAVNKPRGLSELLPPTGSNAGSQPFFAIMQQLRQTSSATDITLEQLNSLALGTESASWVAPSFHPTGQGLPQLLNNSGTPGLQTPDAQISQENFWLQYMEYMQKQLTPAALSSSLNTHVGSNPEVSPLPMTDFTDYELETLLSEAESWLEVFQLNPVLEQPQALAASFETQIDPQTLLPASKLETAFSGPQPWPAITEQSGLSQPLGTPGLKASERLPNRDSVLPQGLVGSLVSQAPQPIDAEESIGREIQLTFAPAESNTETESEQFGLSQWQRWFNDPSAAGTSHPLMRTKVIEDWQRTKDQSSQLLEQAVEQLDVEVEALTELGQVRQTQRNDLVGASQERLLSEAQIRQTDQEFGSLQERLKSAVFLNDESLGDKLASRISLLSQQAVKVAYIQIDPPELGPLEVRLTTQQDQTSVQIVTQHASVRDLLEANIQKLREQFDAQGLNLADVDVSDQSAQQFSQQDGGSAGEQGTGDRASLANRVDEGVNDDGSEQSSNDQLGTARNMIDYYA